MFSVIIEKHFYLIYVKSACDRYAIDPEFPVLVHVKFTFLVTSQRLDIEQTRLYSPKNKIIEQTVGMCSTANHFGIILQSTHQSRLVSFSSI